MALSQTLPSDWKFFAKGNANALFAYSGDNTHFHGKLIRVRLQKDPELYVPVEKLNTYIQQKCEPLFPGQIVGTQMIELPDEFRNQLETVDFALMPSETKGFLMDNVCQGPHKIHRLLKYCKLHVGSSAKKSSNYGCMTSVLLELKPKWLYMPKDVYCRTCLLKQLKGLERHFCCIDLLQEEKSNSVVADLVSAVPLDVQKELAESGFPLFKLIVAFVKRKDNLLHKLMHHQSLDEKDSILGLSCEQDVLDKLSLAMTLRDVGMFLKMRKMDDGEKILEDGDAFVVERKGHTFEVTSYIYDLDLKPKARYTHWKAVEEKLQKFYKENSDWPPCTV